MSTPARGSKRVRNEPSPQRASTARKRRFRVPSDADSSDVADDGGDSGAGATDSDSALPVLERSFADRVSLRVDALRRDVFRTSLYKLCTHAAAVGDGSSAGVPNLSTRKVTVAASTSEVPLSSVAAFGQFLERSEDASGTGRSHCVW